MASIFHPGHYSQLGRGTPVPGRTQGSLDCGPSTVKMGIRQLTRGQLDPSIEDIRRRMGKRGAVPTNTTDAERAVEAYRAADRRPLVYDRLRGSAFERHIRDAVAAGDFVQLAIDYGVFNRKSNRRTGDPNFTGGHSVGVHGWRRRRGKVYWQLFDPLDDGRRAGIPKGPRWVRPGPLLAAWAALGHFCGIFRGGERTR